MNRVVANKLRNISHETFGYYLVRVFEVYPELYKKNKDFHGKNKHLANPLQLVKALVRYWPWLSYEGKKVSLKQMQVRNDPYSMKKAWVFKGQFEFSPDQGGFAPLGEDTEMTVWLHKAYEEHEERLIKKAWRELESGFKGKLFMPDGSEPKLIHKFDKPHVYFMQRSDNGNIKIGVSIHPEVRKKQVRHDVRTDLSILHIVPSGGYELEAKLHEKFMSTNVRGEWFSPSDELLAYIEELKTG